VHAEFILRGAMASGLKSAPYSTLFSSSNEVGKLSWKSFYVFLRAGDENTTEKG
jgi:hypothetical protein